MPDARRRALRAFGVGGEDAARAARLHDHDADAVGDHVVHLARDPAALVRDRLPGLALALLGGERGRLVQLGGMAQAQAHGPAGEPADDHEDPREDRRRSRSGRTPATTPATAAISTASTISPGAALGVAAAAVGEDEQREEGRHELGRLGQPGRRRHGDHPERHRRGDRVAAPPEQQEAHRRGDEHVQPSAGRRWSRAAAPRSRPRRTPPPSARRRACGGDRASRGTLQRKPCADRVAGPGDRLGHELAAVDRDALADPEQLRPRVAEVRTSSATSSAP